MILQHKEIKSFLKFTSFNFTESGLDYGRGVIDKIYLIPFITKSRNKRSMKIAINVNKFEDTLNNAQLWYPNDNINYKTWLTNLMIKLVDVFESQNCYLPILIPLLRVKVNIDRRFFIYYFLKAFFFLILARIL